MFPFPDMNAEAIKCRISSSDIYPYFQIFVCHVSNSVHLHLNINLVYIIHNLKFPQCKSIPYLVKWYPLQCHCSDNKSPSVLHSLIDFLCIILAFGKSSCLHFQNVSLIWSFLPQLLASAAASWELGLPLLWPLTVCFPEAAETIDSLSVLFWLYLSCATV